MDIVTWTDVINTVADDLSHEAIKEVAWAAAEAEKAVRVAQVVNNRGTKETWIALGEVYPVGHIPQLVRVYSPNQGTAIKKLAKEGWEGREDQLTTQEVASWFRNR